MSNKKTQNGQRKSLLAGASVLAAAAAALTGAPAAYAQESAEDEDVIVVTGTRIRQPNLDSPVPVQSIGSETLDLSNSNNAQDILRELPVSGIPAISSTNSGFSTQFGGINTVDLRNLGENRNLVLLNGRRFVGGIAASNIVDFNMLPTELIDRIDVITGGASAVYGSDALAGVINVITKRDFEGVVVNLRGGISEREDNENFGAGLTVGSNFADGRGNATFNASWGKENGVFARNRGDQGMNIDCGLGGPPIGFPQNCPTPSSFSLDGRIVMPNGAAGAAPPLRFNGTTVVPFIPTVDGFNRQAFRVLSVPVERFSFQSMVNYEISPSMEVFVEAIYGRTETSTDIEPFGMDTNDIFATEAFCDSPAGAGLVGDSDLDGNITECFNGVRLSNPLIPAAIRSFVLSQPGNTTRTADEMMIGFARRLGEVGARGADAERQTFRFLTGLRGDLNPDIRYEVAVNYARTSDVQNGSGQVNTSNVQDALDAIDLDGNPATVNDIVCRDPAARAKGCVPLDLFSGPNSITPAMLAWIDAPQLRNAFNEQTYAIGFLEGSFGTGFLPADVSWVLGAESRNEQAEDITDALTRTGQNAGNIAPPTRGQFQVGEVFGEVEIPLLRDQAFAQDLTLHLSARHSNYERAGAELETQAYAASLEYEPFDGLRFRAQAARAVRAPNVGELFGPAGQTFAVVADPCAGLTLSAGQPVFYKTRSSTTNPALVTGSGIDPRSIVGDPAFNANVHNNALNCYADPIVKQRVDSTGGMVLTQPELQGVGGFVGGGSLTLFEETADTLTAGFIFRSPLDNPWLSGFNLSVDYYQIEIADGIGSLGRQNSLNNCYGTATVPIATYTPASAFCTNVIRFAAGPSTGALFGVNSNLQNLSTIETSGVDYQAAWSLNFADAGLFQGSFLADGQFSVTANYSYLSEWSSIAFPGQPQRHFEDSTGLPHDKGTVRLTYNQGPLTLAWSSAYIGEVDMLNNNNGYILPTIWFHSVQARFDVNENSEVFFGVSNVFDEYQPVGGTNGDNGQTVGWTTFPEVYDGLGRRFTAGTRLRF